MKAEPDMHVRPRETDIFDAGLLRRRRDRAARAIASADFLLERSAGDIMDRLAAIKRSFATAANLGAHHGLLSRRLRTQPGTSLVIDVDDAPAMLARCDGPRVGGGLEALPFGDARLDLVVSGLALQFANDLPGVLVQVRRALRPDGLFIGSMLGGATLGELRQALLEAESETAGGASPRVAPFADVRGLGTLMQRAQFALPVVDADTVVVTYPDPLALMRDLRAMGATNVLSQRDRRFLRRDTLARACAIYAERFADAGGRVRATFEIITLTGWAPHASQQRPLAPGSAQTRLADALARPPDAPARQVGKTGQ